MKPILLTLLSITNQLCPTYHNQCLPECPPSFHQTENPNQCTPCSENCEICTISECTQCLPNYALSESNQCISCDHPNCEQCAQNAFFNGNECIDCDNNCLTCTQESYHCLTCAQGFHLEMNTCVENEPHCEFQAHEGCFQCETNYYLQEKNCVITCPEQFYVQNSPFGDICQPCETPCLTCSSKNQCDSCIPPYEKNQQNLCILPQCQPTEFTVNVGQTQECLSCDSNCLTCDTTSKYCLTCPNKSFLSNNTCLPCDSTCETCSGAQPNQCLTCPNNIQTIQDYCPVCTTIDDCYLCQNSLCEQCNPGFYLEGNYCLPCDSDCKTCDIMDTSCTSCHDSYFNNFSTCYPCPNNCEKCDQNACFSCVEGYVLENGSCDSECPEGCLHCDQNACFDCQDGYQMYDGTCYQTCPEKTFEYDGNCLQCEAPCELCNGKQCLSCRQDKYLFDYCPNNSAEMLPEIQQKYQQLQKNIPQKYQKLPNIERQLSITCPSSFYLSNSICLPCPSDCQECSELGCISCESGKYLTQKYTCEPCKSPCATCQYQSSFCLSCSKNPSDLSLSLLFYSNRCYTYCPNEYYLENNTCLTCQEGCKQCSNGNTCDRCKSGYFLQDFSCSPCGFPCNLCDDSGYCLSCEAPFLSFNFGCVRTCPIQWENNGFGTCVEVKTLLQMLMDNMLFLVFIIVTVLSIGGVLFCGKVWVKRQFRQNSLQRLKGEEGAKQLEEFDMKKYMKERFSLEFYQCCCVCCYLLGKKKKQEQIDTVFEREAKEFRQIFLTRLTLDNNEQQQEDVEQNQDFQQIEIQQQVNTIETEPQALYNPKGLKIKEEPVMESKLSLGPIDFSMQEKKMQEKSQDDNNILANSIRPNRLKTLIKSKVMPMVNIQMDVKNLQETKEIKIGDTEVSVSSRPSHQNLQ